MVNNCSFSWSFNVFNKYASSLLLINTAKDFPADFSGCCDDDDDEEEKEEEENVLCFWVVLLSLVSLPLLLRLLRLPPSPPSPLLFSRSLWRGLWWCGATVVYPSVCGMVSTPSSKLCSPVATAVAKEAATSFSCTPYNILKL